MGNRAVIIFTNPDATEFSPAVYLHWNGGPESIYQFLDELDRRKVRADQNYECARFVQIVGEFMDNEKRSSLSLGVMNGPHHMRNVRGMSLGDHGVYLVARVEGGKTIMRRFQRDADEMSAERVAEEEIDARKHKYAADGGFRSVWGDKPVEG